MINIKEKSQCSGCHACYSSCPKQCISMVSDNEGFLYPKIDRSKCTNCGICEKVCPVINKYSTGSQNNLPQVIAAINTDEDARMKSSSGGVFPLIAKWIISQGGIVFGASFSADFKSVIHVGVNKVEDIQKLYGSKYVQSIIGDTYRQAKDALDFGRLVLYTGTPCQISGLYAFLQKNYENLYTQDLICHGVPSPLIWGKYINFREKKANAKTEKMSFRNKDSSWSKYSILFEFSNGDNYKKTLFGDFYMRGFLDNIFLRPSCYKCSFKGMQRQSDITLADFWGVETVCPEMNDDKGTSLVLVNSHKGKTIFDKISSELKFCFVDYNCVAKYNSAAVKSVQIPNSREQFFKTVHAYNLEYAFKKFCNVSYAVKIKRIARGILLKMKRLLIGGKK